LTLQGIIVDLLQEEILLKDFGFGNDNTKVLFVNKKLLPSYKKCIYPINYLSKVQSLCYKETIPRIDNF